MSQFREAAAWDWETLFLSFPLGSPPLLGLGTKEGIWTLTLLAGGHLNKTCLNHTISHSNSLHTVLVLPPKHLTES